MSTTKIHYSDAAIRMAAALIADGQPVAMPTETVYGLAGDACNPTAIARIYAAKSRPAFNPLIVHVSDFQTAQSLAIFDACARQLASVFWPGPLTIILRQQPHCPIAPIATAGLETIALRVPAHRAMQALIAASGCALAAPSANRSGTISPTTARHVLHSLDTRIALVIDDGRCTTGIESTIVSTAADRLTILRPGAITKAQLESASGKSVHGAIDDNTSDNRAEHAGHIGDRQIIKEHCPGEDIIEQIIAPGQMSRHYSPGKAMRLNIRDFVPAEYIIGFGAIAGDYNLSASGDVVEAATRLFDALHCAAMSPKPAIAVAPIPTHGLGHAIADRLHRAAIAEPKT